MDQQQNPFGNQPAFQPEMAPSRRNPRRVVLALVVLFITIVLVVAAVIYLLTGFGKSTDQSNVATTNAISDKVAVITVTSGGFVPQDLSVKAGQQVEFKNTDTVPHRLTADNNKPEDFDSPEAVNANESYIYVFDTPGTYHYYDPQNVNKYVGTITVEQ